MFWQCDVSKKRREHQNVINHLTRDGTLFPVFGVRITRRIVWECWAHGNGLSPNQLEKKAFLAKSPNFESLFAKMSVFNIFVK